MPVSFETFAWAVSSLFQLLTVCAYLLSFPDVDGVDDQLPDIDGVDDQLPDMPEVIQDSAIEMKITYSGIIFVFGFYTQVVVVKQRWNWWRKKMEEHKFSSCGSSFNDHKPPHPYFNRHHTLISTDLDVPPRNWDKASPKMAKNFGRPLRSRAAQ